MYFIYEYEICGLIFSLLFSLYYFSRKKINTLQNNIFTSIVIIANVNIILDLLSAIIQAMFIDVNITFQYIINVLCLITQQALPLLFLSYIFVIIRRDSMPNLIKTMLILSPGFFVVLMIISSPFSNIIFYFNNDNIYQHGSLHFVLYINSIFYILFAIIIFLHKSTKDERIRFIPLLVYSVIGFIIEIIQFINPEYLLASVLVSIGIFVIYFSMETKTDYVNKLTNQFNKDALYLSMHDLFIKNKNFSIIFVSSGNYSNIKSSFGYTYACEIKINTNLALKKLYRHQKIFELESSCFAILFPKKHDMDYEVNSLKKRFPSNFEINNVSLNISPIFVLVNSNDFKDSNEMFNITDHIIKKILIDNREAVNIINSKTIENTKRELEIIKAITNAINNNEIEVFYQPIHSAKNGELKYLEALARLKDTKMSYIPPDDFIKLAEKNDSIIKLGHLIFNNICQFLSALNKKGINDIIITVNLSVAQCIQQNLVENIENTITKYSIDPSRIIFEITETYESKSMNLLKEVMTTLSNKGFSFALDDYGTKYSNLEYIINLPFKYIKIDKSLLKASEKSDNFKTLFLSSIQTFTSIGLIVICEGIETKEQYKFIKQTNIDSIQGFFFSKPLEENGIIEYINNSK